MPLEVGDRVKLLCDYPGSFGAYRKDTVGEIANIRGDKATVKMKPEGDDREIYRTRVLLEDLEKV